jgi:hypothetical protein
MFGKRGFQFSFAWLFAIIAGGFILFLAIFAATSLVNQGQSRLDITSAKQFEIITNPLQTSFESGISTEVTFPSRTRVYNRCTLAGAFGEQRLSVAQQTGFLKDWPKPSEEIVSQNKYFFSESVIEGEDFVIFSKPINYPFKVADIFIISPIEKNYCFVNPPDNIKNEIKALNKNMFADQCPEKSVRVCFGSGSLCNITVTGSCTNEFNCESEYDTGIVQKEGKQLTYSNGLLYGAIFSDVETYECQVQRLMKRVSELCELYIEESNFVSIKDCNTNIEPELVQLMQLSKELDKSSGLGAIDLIVKRLEEKQEDVICQLW